MVQTKRDHQTTNKISLDLNEVQVGVGGKRLIFEIFFNQNKFSITGTLLQIE